MRYVPYKHDRPPWSHWRTGQRWRRRSSCEHWWMSWWTGRLPAGWFRLLGWWRPPLQSSWRKCSHLTPTQTEALLAQVLIHPAHKTPRSKTKGLLVPRWRRFSSQPKSFFSCFGLKRFSKENYCDIHLKLGEMRELSARTIDPYLGNLSRILTSSFLSTSCCLNYIILLYNLDIYHSNCRFYRPKRHQVRVDHVPGFQKPFQPVLEFHFFSTNLWWLCVLNSAQLFWITFCNSLWSLGFL